MLYPAHILEQACAMAQGCRKAPPNVVILRCRMLAHSVPPLGSPSGGPGDPPSLRLNSRTKPVGFAPSLVRCLPQSVQSVAQSASPWRALGLSGNGRDSLHASPPPTVCWCWRAGIARRDFSGNLLRTCTSNSTAAQAKPRCGSGGAKGIDHVSRLERRRPGSARRGRLDWGARPLLRAS